MIRRLLIFWLDLFIHLRSANNVLDVVGANDERIVNLLELFRAHQERVLVQIVELTLLILGILLAALLEIAKRICFYNMKVVKLLMKWFILAREVVLGLAEHFAIYKGLLFAILLAGGGDSYLHGNV